MEATHMHAEKQHEMHIDAKHKKDVMARLKSVEGHVRGIERMVEEDVYCVDVIKQTLAVQKAPMVSTPSCWRTISIPALRRLCAVKTAKSASGLSARLSMCSKQHRSCRNEAGEA